MICTSLAPSAAARCSPASTARYSATLLVATPIRSACAASTAPSGAEATTPVAAGTGLPRAPPSTWTTSVGGEIEPAGLNRWLAREARRGRGDDADRGP